jgi:hypothetical protein
MIPRVAHTTQNDQRIDEALRRLGSATPRHGMEERIKLRLSQALSEQAPRSRFFAIPRFALGAAAGALACVAIVVGSVYHSRATQPTLPGIVARPSTTGLGSAGAARPASHPVEPGPTERPRSVRRVPQGRAVISPQSQRPTGVAVPRSPTPAQ